MEALSISLSSYHMIRFFSVALKYLPFVNDCNMFELWNKDTSLFGRSGGNLDQVTIGLFLHPHTAYK